MNAGQPSLTLYDFELSANCYKVRLLLSLLGLEYQRQSINLFPAFEHRKPEFLQINPLGQLPVLIDGELILRDSQAILLYLAKSYDASRRWLPEEPALFGPAMMWLFFAASELSAATAARFHDLFGVRTDIDAARTNARRAIRVMDDHMTRREIGGGSWFVGEHPTLADLALFPSIALSRDFGLEHDEFAALRRWMRRLRGLENFVVMPGIPEFY